MGNTRHPARCNRRECQARRNLSKHPALYVTWPKCHVCKVGKMYVDWYRMKKGPRDNPRVCRDDNCPWLENHMRNGGKFAPFHRVSTRGCSGYEDYRLERAVVGSKHCPRALRQDDAPPF